VIKIFIKQPGVVKMQIEDDRTAEQKRLILGLLSVLIAL